jgi:hypothetical protein
VALSELSFSTFFPHSWIKGWRRGEWERGVERA